MRYRIAVGVAALAVALAMPAAAVPDSDFTAAHYKYVEMKRQEFLAPIVAKGLTPTAAQNAEATCRAIMWWKMANPGGEAKLTFFALVALRRAEVFCGQKMRRPAPLPIETGNPPVTTIPAGSNRDGGEEAVDDFVRWHQVTVTSASSIMELVYYRVLIWGMFGPGKDLYEELRKAEEALRAAMATPGSNFQSAALAVDVARKKLAAAEADEATKAALEYAAAHPITTENAASIMEYVRAQVFLWGNSEAAKKLYDDLAAAEAALKDALATPGANTQSAYQAVDVARARIAAAEAEAATKAALEYAAAHPITVQNAKTIMEYVHAQVFLWGNSEAAKKLYDDLAAAEAALKDALATPGANTQSAYQAVDTARARIAAAEAAAAEKAAEEYARAHPVTVNAASTADYVHAQVFLWERSEEAKKLYDDLAKARAEYQDALRNGGNYLSRDQDVKAAQARLNAAEAAAAEKAQMEWRAAHPGQPEVWPQPPAAGANDGAYRIGPTDPRVWSGIGGAGSYPVPTENLPRWKQIEIQEWEDRVANGSVDPLDAEKWARARGQAREPVVVGANDKVGSGARDRDKAVSTALGIAGGLLGIGGGGGGQNGPKTVNCRIADRDMTVFDDPQTGVQLKVAARRQGDNILVYSDIARSPDQGTFQAAILDDRNGQWRTPTDAGICKLHGEWSLSVSWTRTTYANNRVVGRDAGGWSKAGSFELLGTADGAGAPTGMWKQLGFSNASHGARMVQTSYPAPAQAFRNGGLDVVIHVTRPAQNPVTTVPFALRVTEGPKGFVFERIQ